MLAVIVSFFLKMNRLNARATRANLEDKYQKNEADVTSANDSSDHAAVQDASKLVLAPADSLEKIGDKSRLMNNL